MLVAVGRDFTFAGGSAVPSRVDRTSGRGRRISRAICGFFGAMIAATAIAQARPIDLVAAENFYGDVARQIGGDDVSVTSILNNPDQDPHEFEANPSTARALARAAIVISNGADYDPWVLKLLAASPSPSRR